MMFQPITLGVTSAFMKRTGTGYFAHYASAIIMLLATWIWAADSHASARQYKIEAAFLYNFFNYITWPDQNSPETLEEPVICTFPGDPIIPYLAYVQEKSKDTRPLQVREMKAGDMNGCHLLYTRHLLDAPLEKQAWKQGVLLVSSEEELQSDVMIGLLQKDQRIIMRIHHQRMLDAGFTVSSRLLSLAETIE